MTIAAIWFAFAFRSGIRDQVANNLQRVCRTHANAFRARDEARIREAERFSESQAVRSIAQRLVQVSKSENAKKALQKCREVSEFYAATSDYTLAHEGAALHLVSRDGVILADTNPEYLGRRINADAFRYVIPAFQGKTTVTPLVRDGSMAVDPPNGVSKSASHSYIVVPVKGESEIHAALAAMEFSNKGYLKVLGVSDHDKSGTVTSIVDDKGRIVLSSDGGNTDAPKRPTHNDGTSNKLLTKLAAALGDEGRELTGVILQPYTNHRGMKVVGAWHWIPESAMGVVIEQESKLVFWPLHRMIGAMAFNLTCVLGVMSWTPIRDAILHDRHRATDSIDGRFRVENVIGAGGSSNVFRARDTVLDRDVAIKVLKREHFGKNAASRFQREIRVLSGLTHPSTIRVFDAGMLHSGDPYYVMELLNGMTLAEVVRRHGELVEARAIELVVHICSSLSEAHAAGIIHRDIKPQNVIVSNFATSEEYVKVLDFGLGKNIFQDVQQITSTSEITGTLQFMAPECIMSPENAGPQSDVYSVGGLLFFLLTGEALYDGESSLRAVHSIVNSKPNLSLLTNVDVSEPMLSLVKSCLSKQPSERPQDAKTLKHLLLSTRT